MHHSLTHPKRKPAWGSSHLLKTCPFQSLQCAMLLLSAEGVLSTTQNRERAAPALKLLQSEQ